MSSLNLQALYSTFVGLLLSFWLGGAVLVWRNRHLQPLRARKPWLSILYGGSVAVFASLSGAFHIFPNMSCGEIFFPWTLFFGLFVNTLFFRLLLLYYLFLIAHTSAHHEETEGVSEKWIMRHRSVVKSKNFVAALTVSNVLFSLPMLVQIFLNPEDAARPGNDPFCLTESAMARFFLRFYSLLVVLLGFLNFSIAMKLKKVEENFFIKEEFKKESYIVMFCMTQYFIWRLTPLRSALGSNDIENLCLQILPSFVLQYLSLYEPYRRVSEFNNAAIQDRQTQVHSVQAVGRPNDLAEDMTRVLNTKRGFEAMKKFCIKELSVENILFWKDVTELQREFNGGKRSEAVMLENIEKIVETYCRYASVLSINISFEMRERILDMERNDLHGKEQNVRKCMSLLAEVRQEITLLMAWDTFVRFKRSAAYLELIDK